MSPLEWMAWTTPTALFFIAVILMLITTTILGLRSPSVARKGVLPMATTRGDRLYVGLLGCAFIALAWLGLSDESSLIAVGICVVWLIAILRWG